MERCSVCSEKAYLSNCAHCEKKICEDCKSAHMDILRREITRFNSQIRRSLHRLQDSLASIEKNMTSLQTNCVSVTDEVEEIYRRITKAIKDRSDQLKGEVDRYLTVELRNLITLKENLDLEMTNIQSNCDVVDKYMNETVEWDDAELMDTKEIFLKTVEFLRHYEYENSDYSRRVRFLVSIDPNQLVMNLATFGDLNITPHSAASGSLSSSHLAPASSTLQPGLMRSKSDHRLATQFRQQEERAGGYNDEPVLGGRKFGERPVRSQTDRYGADSNRYANRDYEYDNDYDSEQTSRTTNKSRFRSRFVRSHQNEDSDNEQQLQRADNDKRKDRVLDGEDVSRGQLSGIIRLSDCARVIQRLADIGKEKKEKKVDTAAQAAVQAAIQAQKASMTRPKQTAALRQASEDDEISQIKRQNKNAPGSSATTALNTAVNTDGERPPVDRLTAVKRPGHDDSEGTNHASSVRRTPSRAEVSVTEANEEEDSSSDSEHEKEADEVDGRESSVDINVEEVDEEEEEDGEEEDEEEEEEEDTEDDEEENKIDTADNVNPIVDNLVDNNTRLENDDETEVSDTEDTATETECETETDSETT